MGCVELEYSKSKDTYAKDKTTVSYLSKLSHNANPAIMRFLDNSVLYVVMALIIIRVSKENLSSRFPFKGIIMVSRMI